MTAPAPAPQGAAILDSHSHAWRLWPYPPAVPDEDARGAIEQLLYEMDANGVAQALVVCAAIGANPDNTALSTARVRESDGNSAADVASDIGASVALGLAFSLIDGLLRSGDSD